MSSVACVAMLNKLGWALEVGKYLLPAALSASVSLLPQLESAYLLEHWKTFETVTSSFSSYSSPCLTLSFLMRAELKTLSGWPGLLFGNASSVLLALVCLDSALSLLYLLPNNCCAQEHEMQFFSPCHQTNPLSCPLLPAVISVTCVKSPGFLYS